MLAPRNQATWGGFLGGSIRGETSLPFPRKGSHLGGLRPAKEEPLGHDDRSGLRSEFHVREVAAEHRARARQDRHPAALDPELDLSVLADGIARAAAATASIGLIQGGWCCPRQGKPLTRGNGGTGHRRPNGSMRVGSAPWRRTATVRLLWRPVGWQCVESVALEADLVAL